MKIRIEETGNIEYLSIIDPSTGLAWTADFINVAYDDQFTHFNDAIGDPYDYDGEDFDYETSQENFDWWEKVTKEYEAAQFRIHDLRQEHGSKVDDVIRDLGTNDLEDQAKAINEALDEAFGE